jgi:hypothetical protein
MIAIGDEHNGLIGIKPPRDHGGSFVFAFDQDQVVVDIHAFASFLGVWVYYSKFGWGCQGGNEKARASGEVRAFLYQLLIRSCASLY